MLRNYESVKITYDLRKSHRVGLALVKRIYLKNDATHISFLCDFFHNTMWVELYVAPNFCHKVKKELPLIILDNAIEIWYDELELYV